MDFNPDTRGTVADWVGGLGTIAAFLAPALVINRDAKDCGTTWQALGQWASASPPTPAPAVSRQRASTPAWGSKSAGGQEKCSPKGASLRPCAG